MADTLLYIALGLPVLSSLVIALAWLHGANRGERGEVFTSNVLLASASASLLILVTISIGFYLDNLILPARLRAGIWFASGTVKIPFELLFDFYSLVIGPLIALIAVLTLRFSRYYLHREAGFQRYHIIMGLFISAMLLMVYSGNAITAFIGWELAGVSSYLLIAYSYDRPVATGNATRAFVANRIGDAGFLAAIIFSLAWFGTTGWITEDVSWIQKAEKYQLDLIALGFILAAMAKSAAVPFSAWITRALEGPTPSSAIFYGSIMVHAGVFLLIRISPLVSEVLFLQLVLVVTGLMTVIYGFVGGLVQTDVKTAFMFSTTGQIGIMFITCGLGFEEVAFVHLLAHAVWRAYQFLHAPSHMHLVSRAARPVPGWLAKYHWLYIAAVQRFWLDNLANALFVRPSYMMANEIQVFDDSVVNRIAGLPEQVGALSSVADWEEKKFSKDNKDRAKPISAKGLLGSMMDTVATALHWFEEHLVLKGGGESLVDLIQRIGGYAQQVEKLLSQPRYLWLLIFATFMVII